MKSLILFCYAAFLATGIAASPIDSVSGEKKKSSNLRLTTRVHSLGLFNYGGRLVSEGHVMDVNLHYDRKAWGFQLFKAVDFRDSRTPINFTLMVLNKNFRLGKRITVTPSVGCILEQFESIADHGSDAVVLVTTTFKMNKDLTLEHTTLAGNLVLEPEMRDWVNRIRLIFSRNHLDLTLMGWHNNSWLDTTEYFTLGSSIFFSRLKVSEGLAVNAGLTGIFMPYSSDGDAGVPKVNGAFITLGLTID